ncbi:MAG: response regulator [Planctomycetota bacterium]|nr:response regulator [Planctomycetota bacterium]
MADGRPAILLVDDDPDFLDLVQEVLEGRGYRVIRASSPADALAAVAREIPDLIVTDLMMTSLDSGFALARQLKADPRLAAVPVVVATAVAKKLGISFLPGNAGDLEAMKADAYFEKPLDPDAFLRKVSELISRREDAKRRGI